MTLEFKNPLVTDIVENRTRQTLEDIAWLYGFSIASSRKTTKKAGWESAQVIAGEKLERVLDAGLSNSEVATILDSNFTYLSQNHEAFEWITDNEGYSLQFLSSYFDIAGDVLKENSTNYILFRSNSDVGVDFILKALDRTGIQSAKVWISKSEPAGIRGVRISERNDLIFLSKKLESCVEKKHLRLEELGNLTPPENITLPEKPSENLAWLWGLMVAHGRKNIESNLIAFQNQHPEVIDRYIAVFNELFGVQRKPVSKVTKSGSSQYIGIHSTMIKDFFGDLSVQGWWRNINKNSSWVFQDEYIKHFFGGYFDTKGSFTLFKKSTRVMLGCSDLEAAEGIRDYLRKLGVNSRLSWHYKGEKVLAGLTITNTPDIILFSKIVVPTVTSIRNNLKTFDGAESVNIVPPQILEAYRLTMEAVQADPNINAAEVLNLPSFVGFRDFVTKRQVWGWITLGQSPLKDPQYLRWYGKDQMASRDLANLLISQRDDLSYDDYEMCFQYFERFGIAVHDEEKMTNVLTTLFSLEKPSLEVILKNEKVNLMSMRFADRVKGLRGKLSEIEYNWLINNFEMIEKQSESEEGLDAVVRYLGGLQSNSFRWLAYDKFVLTPVTIKEIIGKV